MKIVKEFADGQQLTPEQEAEAKKRSKEILVKYSAVSGINIVSKVNDGHLYDELLNEGYHHDCTPDDNCGDCGDCRS